MRIKSLAFECYKQIASSQAARIGMNTADLGGFIAHQGAGDLAAAE